MEEFVCHISRTGDRNVLLPVMGEQQKNPKSEKNPLKFIFDTFEGAYDQIASLK